MFIELKNDNCTKKIPEIGDEIFERMQNTREGTGRRIITVKSWVEIFVNKKMSN